MIEKESLLEAKMVPKSTPEASFCQANINLYRSRFGTRFCHFWATFQSILGFKLINIDTPKTTKNKAAFLRSPRAMEGGRGEVNLPPRDWFEWRTWRDLGFEYCSWHLHASRHKASADYFKLILTGLGGELFSVVLREASFDF